MSEHPRLQAIPGGLDEQPRPSRQGTSPTAAPRGANSPRPPLRGVPTPPARPTREPLWREALGERLRALRLEQGEKLTETAGRAGLSPQYLSEVERGLKEPSSEMIAALAGALGTSLGNLTRQVAEDLLRHRPAQPSRALISPLAVSPVMLAA
ncbi:helix-turn-helix domain-containing protein [Nocardia sp. NBC_00511]|uniref:helix-turn-helix domain-containing protein n=1 Tax=Nocardia sp. NBC_00511 TaxID=2903591 RepID=UPI0030E43590